MSLSIEQKEATKVELKENLERSGLEIRQIAKDLQTSERYIGELLELRPKRYEDTWILRNYLFDAVQKIGKEPMPFSVLKADPHEIWFLDANYIDKGVIRKK